MDPYIYFNPNPFCDSLKTNWQTIKKELYDFMHIRGIVDKDGNILSNDQTQSGVKPNALETLYSGSFKSLCIYIKSNMLDKFEMEAMNWGAEEKERWSPYARRMGFLSPFIYAYKDVIGSAVFNISYPGSELKHHFGLDPDYIRLHLCIKEDSHCVFDIENHRHTWTDGELFAFDDANVLHGTKHFVEEGAGPRIILLMDVKKEFLKPFAQTWPCRDTRPKISELPKLTGWGEKQLQTFVSSDA